MQFISEHYLPVPNVLEGNGETYQVHFMTLKTLFFPLESL